MRIAADLRGVEDQDAALAAAKAARVKAEADYVNAAAALTAARKEAAEHLSQSVATELGPLRLDRAKFRVEITPLAPERAGPLGVDRVAFEVSTHPGAAFGGLGDIASGGELARFALAMKASLATRDGPEAPGLAMIFDEVDQGVGGAVAAAVGARLRRLADDGTQVLVVTHSPQVAARAHHHWRVSKSSDSETFVTHVEALTDAEREGEIARMLSGAEVTDAARAAARALISG